MNVVLKPLTRNLLETLRIWRNQNRKYFIWQGIVTTTMQNKWWEKYKQNPTEKAYVIYYRGKPVGTLSTIYKRKEIELGRVMLGEKRYARRGVMSSAINKALSKFKNTRVYIKVLNNNHSAISFYKKNHFKIYKRNEKLTFMEKFI